MTAAILSSHRVISPYGLQGGESGALGGIMLNGMREMCGGIRKVLRRWNESVRCL
jgi:N-methylhydantoinase B/oxoprolinase/acetone carboxylase alpha subunit